MNEEIREDVSIEESENVEEFEEKKKGFHINIHIILILMIVAVLGLSAYKLARWNHGEQIDIDPNEDTSEFDVEILDEIMPMTPVEGHVYDDETTVLILGNGAMSITRMEENGLANKIAQSSGTTVYNASFPFVTLATRNLAMIEQNYPDDIYSLSYLADAMCSGDFAEIDRVTNTYHPDGGATIAAVQTLKSVDYDNLDVIVIAYDAMDYFEGRAIENPKDDEERCTIVGSLNYFVRKVHATYPYVRIIVSSLYYVEGVNADGSTYDPDTMDAGNGTLSNYLFNELNAASALSVSFLDNFYGTINHDNVKDLAYYDPEQKYIVLTEEGQQVLADRIAYAINKFPNDK